MMTRLHQQHHPWGVVALSLSSPLLLSAAPLLPGALALLALLLAVAIAAIAASDSGANEVVVIHHDYYLIGFTMVPRLCLCLCFRHDNYNNCHLFS